MKTTNELIIDIQKEYIARRELGETHYDIKDYYAFFYVKKYFSDEEKAKFSKEALFKSLEYFKAKRKKVTEEHSEVQMNYFEVLTKEVHPFQTLFKFCIPFASSILTEDNIITFLSYYDAPYPLKYFNEYQNKYFELDISHSLLYYNFMLELIIHYQEHHAISNHIIEKLEQLKKHSGLKENDYKVEKIDAVINGTGVVSDVPLQEELKPLSAKDLATAKKMEMATRL